MYPDYITLSLHSLLEVSQLPDIDIARRHTEYLIISLHIHKHGYLVQLNEEEEGPSEGDGGRNISNILPTSHSEGRCGLV